MTIWIVAAWFISLQCKAETAPSDRPIRFVTSQAPLTLNPRRALNSQTQKLGSLLFAALTHKAKDLTTEPDLATSWRDLESHRVFEFQFGSGRVDHTNTPITATDMVTCLENYRSAKPLSPLAASILGWKATRLVKRGDTSIVRIELTQADPYFPRNASLLRFFRTPGQAPCAEPSAGAAVIVGSGAWKPSEGETLPLRPERELALRAPSGQRFIVLFIGDDSVRTLTLEKGDAEVSYNAISLSKVPWLKNKGWQVIAAPYTAVDYLAFNLKHPILSHLAVRKALAHATDRETIVRHKLFGYGSVAESFLSPLLREFPRGTRKTRYDFNLDQARKILETAGFAQKEDGFRFSLKIRTTPVREGIERAQMLRDSWAKIGVNLEIDVVEPAVFAESLKNGNFEIYGSQWVGISDPSILNQTLLPGSPKNRAHYDSATMTGLLKKLAAADSLVETQRLVSSVQELMLDDLPYFPLWYWDTTLVLSSKLSPVPASMLSLTAMWEDLDQLRWRPQP